MAHHPDENRASLLRIYLYTVFPPYCQRMYLLLVECNLLRIVLRLFLRIK